VSGAPASETASVFGLLESRARAHAGHVASRTRRGGSWEWTTWGDLRDAAAALSTALVLRGVKKGDRVALMAATREEWTVTDFAVMALGAVTVPIYPTATAPQVAHVLDDAACVLALVETAAHRAIVERARSATSVLRELIVLEQGAAEPGALPVTAYTALVKSGRDALEAPEERRRFEERRHSVTGEDVATVVYTSGTTGPPRGVKLTHAALLAQTRALLSTFEVRPDDEQLLILPLAHIFAKILVLTHVASGARLAYSEGPHRLTRDLGEIEPTFFATVPRFLEKVYTVANESARAEGPLRAALFTWAIDVGKRRAARRSQGLEPRRLLSAQARYADRLVLARVRSAFGSRLRFVISGAAPLSRELAEWLLACGITVLEGYGLTEIGGASHVNRPGRPRLGTVGQPLPGYAAKLAPDGEVLLRGPSTMQGYVNDDAATRTAVDAEGWVHTGDVGKVDDDGYLEIVDRKKDVLVTAGGSNVAPQNIEARLLESPWVAQAVVFGDRRPYLVALLTLDAVMCRRWAEERGRKADLALLANDPELVAQIHLDVDAVNRHLASFETIKRFALLPEPFSRDTLELTELGKLRRDVIRVRRAAEIEALYA
jgi:long-chain acyl-CoA synthetase